MTDPLQSLPELKSLREQLAAVPVASPERPVLLEQLAAAVQATRPAPRLRLPARQRWALLGFVLVVGGVGYAVTGNWQGWRSAPAVDPGELMVQRLADRLAADPAGARATDWAMLGRSLTVLGRQAQAIAAYRQALAKEAQPDTLAALADLLASQQGGSLKGEPEQLVAQALALNADHPQALALAAAAAWEAGRVDEARSRWQRLQKLLPPGDALREAAEQGLSMPDTRRP